MTTSAQPDPDVDLSATIEVARDILVIGNRNVDLVPNVGVIGGTEAVLVIDTGMGPVNGDRVADFAQDYAHGRRLLLTTTHFHPEHAFGAQSFAGRATYVVNSAQARDRADRGTGYLAMFRGLGDTIAARLDGVELTPPDEVYDGVHRIDLGGRVVELRPTGQAHTRGDQVIAVPDADLLFTGDLVETGQFAIFPWFPPHDVDVSGVRWIEVMRRLAAGRPATVVPGHGDLGGPERLDTVLDYLQRLRDETWKRRDSGESEDAIAEEVTALMLEQHIDWRGQEWIRPGVGCLCSEHPHDVTASNDE